MTPEYKLRRRFKHEVQRNPVLPEVSLSSDPTPDGLGLWEGGRQELKSPTFGLKGRATALGNRKNTPGKASKEVIERSADYFKQGNNAVPLAALPEVSPEDVEGSVQEVVAPLQIEESDNVPCDAGQESNAEPSVGA